MQDPVCPYCGTEMRIFTHTVCNMLLAHGYAICPECGSTGPRVIPEDVWDIEGDQLREAVKKETLRRPLQKPLTLEDVLKIDDYGEAWWVEYEAGFVAPTILNNDCHQYGEQILDGFTFELADYGKTWRAWASRPTDEERAAAPWEE